MKKGSRHDVLVYFSQRSIILWNSLKSEAGESGYAPG